MTWSHWHAKLHQTLNTHPLLPQHSRILIAVSGGQDSLCLLQLLQDLQPKWQWHLGVIHCNHRWRTDADANAEHVRSLTQSRHLPLWIETAPTPPNSEAAARQWRYNCFIHLAHHENFTHVTTGHTQTDRAETLLYNLIRGSGADGLQALTWQRPLSSNCQLIRPLLNFSRAATAECCQAFHLPIWEDSTNIDQTYARNRIRQSVLPYLHQHLNPQAETHLAQTAELLTADVEYLETQAAQLYQQAIAPPTPPHCLDRHLLQTTPLALQRRVIRRFLQTHLPQAPNFAQIEAVVGLITAPNRSQTSSLTAGAIVVVDRPYLRIL